jgi:hypothetical protein
MIVADVGGAGVEVSELNGVGVDSFCSTWAAFSSFSALVSLDSVESRAIRCRISNFAGATRGCVVAEPE